MGGALSRVSLSALVLPLFASSRNRRVLMVGLDNAGKTTLLYKLKLGEVLSTAPTIGFNVETVVHNKTTLTVWDIGGQEKIRQLWRYYYTGVSTVVFVVDSCDAARVVEAGRELREMMANDELREASVLVFANKQDRPEALPVDRISSDMGLPGLRCRNWHLQPASAVTGAGVFEGLAWIADS